jgi:hypothetical protein
MLQIVPSIFSKKAPTIFPEGEGNFEDFSEEPHLSSPKEREISKNLAKRPHLSSPKGKKISKI